MGRLVRVPCAAFPAPCSQTPSCPTRRRPSPIAESVPSPLPRQLPAAVAALLTKRTAVDRMCSEGPCFSVNQPDPNRSKQIQTDAATGGGGAEPLHPDMGQHRPSSQTFALETAMCDENYLSCEGPRLVRHLSQPHARCSKVHVGSVSRSCQGGFPLASCPPRRLSEAPPNHSVKGSPPLGDLLPTWLVRMPLSGVSMQTCRARPWARVPDLASSAF